MKFEWERLEDDPSGETEIAKVFGGWVLYRSEINKTMESDHEMSKDHRVISMVFIPDPEHKWEI